MFNDEFFPTPDAVIERMIEPLYVTYMDYPEHSFFGPRRGKLYCFEIDPTLQATLQGKNYRLLGYDFLKYSGDMPIELILMNPPFSNADQHCLHAYSILAPKGQLVAVVNSETLRNPYSRTRRQLLNLIDQVGGTVEELGAAFRDSERPTDVEVSIIRLRKPEGADRFTFDWQNLSREREFDTSRDNIREVAGRDVIGNMLTQYDCLREQFLNLLRAIDGIKHYGAGLSSEKTLSDAWRIARDIIESPQERGGASYRQQYLSFTEQMRQQIWGVVLEKVDITKFMTEAVRANFRKYSAATGWLDFTRENVAQLVGMVLDNTGNILEVAIADLFDEFTKFHHENRCHVEGWKTNSRYKVNRRLVLPNYVEFGEFGNEFRMDSRHRDKYADIDKVMCYLTGERYESTVLIADALEAQFRQLGRVGMGTFDNTCESKFFKIRFYKKGTVHLEFLDSRLHQEFNLRACAGKQWLPAEEQQAYQSRRTSPFPKATPAPGTDHAAMVGNGATEQVLRQLLGSGGSLTPPMATQAMLEPVQEAATVTEVDAEVVTAARPPVGPGRQLGLFASGPECRAAA